MHISLIVRLFQTMASQNCTTRSGCCARVEERTGGGGGGERGAMHAPSHLQQAGCLCSAGTHAKSARGAQPRRSAVRPR